MEMDAKQVSWQTWHTPLPQVLDLVASPAFSHGRAKYVGFLGGYEVYLYKRDPESPTGVRNCGSCPDCPEVYEAMRARGKSIEPPH
jgi:hypothetical protein